VRRAARCAAAALLLVAGSVGAETPGAPQEGAAPGRTAPAEASAARPNLLLVTLDTVRADHLGLHGYARDTSPALDAFAETAVVFDAAQATSSWTLPSLASTLTGVYPATHGADANDTMLAPGVETLAEALARAGYDTAGIVTHVFAGERYGMHRGFGRFDDDLTNEQRAHELVTSPWLGVKAAVWLEQRRREETGRPWFLWLHFFDPHLEYRVHEGVSERFGTERPLDRYDGEIAFTDDHVGKLLAHLEKLDFPRDTVVAVTADHGEAFGEHGAKLHRQNLYGEVLRIPLLVRAPGFAPRRVAEPVSLVDLAPTLADLAGVDPPAQAVGRSLVPAMRGEPLPERPLLAELRHRPDVVERAVVEGRWKLVRSPRTKRDQLFDRAADPLDTRDLAEQHPERVRALAERLDALAAEAGELAAGLEEAGRIELSEDERRRLEALGYATEE